MKRLLLALGLAFAVCLAWGQNATIDVQVGPAQGSFTGSSMSTGAFDTNSHPNECAFVDVISTSSYPTAVTLLDNGTPVGTAGVQVAATEPWCQIWEIQGVPQIGGSLGVIKVTFNTSTGTAHIGAEIFYNCSGAVNNVTGSTSSANMTVATQKGDAVFCAANCNQFSTTGGFTGHEQDSSGTGSTGYIIYGYTTGYTTSTVTYSWNVILTPFVQQTAVNVVSVGNAWIVGGAGLLTGVGMLEAPPPEWREGSAASTGNRKIASASRRAA